MKDFEAAKDIFKDYVDPSFYFDSISSEIARLKLQEVLLEKSISLIFLIGEPGVGKTHIMRLMHAMNSQSYPSLLLEQPFFDVLDFYKTLYHLKKREFQQGKTLLMYQEELFEMYAHQPCTIFLDEAHLLSFKQLEFIRILSDTKLFQFILAMHTEDAKMLLSKKQFESRSKIVIEYGNLEENEVLRYIQTALMNKALGDIALLFSATHSKFITRHTKGNFRVIKKFLYMLMKFLDFAKKNELKKYDTINGCLLTMVALEIGLIDDK